VSSPGFGFGSISAGIGGRFALFGLKMDPFCLKLGAWVGSGLGCSLGATRGSVLLGSVRLAGFRGSVGRSVGLVGSGRSGALGQGVGLVVGSGWQVIRSGRLGELLSARGQNVKGLGVPNN